MKYPVLLNKKTGRYASIPDRALLALQAEAMELRGSGPVGEGILKLLLPSTSKAQSRLIKIMKANRVLLRAPRAETGVREASERVRLLIEDDDRFLVSLAELFLNEVGRESVKITVISFVRWSRNRLKAQDTLIRRIIPEAEVREQLSQRSIDWWKARIAERRRKARVSRRI